MSLLSQFHFKGLQEQAATNSNPAIAVTAGAGSGKTLSLVGRYLHLLELGYPLRSILAITFTEKAAREMRTRIRASLIAPEFDDLISSDIGRNGIDSARISTIHSLCAEILRAHPAEAGLDPAFGVLEEGLTAALQAEAIGSALAWAATDEQSVALFGVLKENEVRQALTWLTEHRLDIISGKQGDVRETFSSYLSQYLAHSLASPAWFDAIADLATRRATSPDDKLEFARQSVLAQWTIIQAANTAQNWDSVLVGLASLRKAIESRGGRKESWSESDLAAVREDMSALKAIYDENLKFLAEKSRFALDEKVVAHIPTLDRLLGQALLEYQRRKDERQSLDFDDLEGLTAQLLLSHPSVRAGLQTELRAVLVDEFQDTNERQRQIVYALAGFSRSLTVDDRRDSHPDLFIVGDPKQSIYKFRGADVAVFRRVAADIQATGGQLINLDLTFRAHKFLLDALNSLLAPILGETDDPARPYLVPFAPLRAYRQAPVREVIQPPFIEFQLGLGENAETGRQAAAFALANRLSQFHDTEGFAWGEMALLFRSSSGFTVYETALESAGIPFVTVAGRGFYDRPEIRDLLNALAAIADPADDLALVGLLRSPAFAIPDVDIYRLFTRMDGGKRKEDEEIFRFNALSQPGYLENASFQRAYRIIKELQTLAGRAPAASVLKRFLDLTGYLAILACLPNGTRMLRNVEKLLADAHRSRLVSLPAFLTYIRTLGDVGLREGEAAADASGSGSVQLMTIHKAKGLEFPLVVLADAAHEAHNRTGCVQLFSDNSLLDIQENDFHPTSWQLAARHEAEIDAAEDSRLLYVAATRAKEKFLISGHVKRKKDGGLDLNGWLSLLGPVVGLDTIHVSENLSQPERYPSHVSGILLHVHPHSATVESPQPVPISADSSRRRASDESGSNRMLEPISPVLPIIDEKTRAREVDPPQRVWRVVSTTKTPHAPAWVVGRLVHECLRRWRFPAQAHRGFPEGEFENFLRPFALESGLTDLEVIHAVYQESRRLLERFNAHQVFIEMDAAERYHEVPYFLPDDRGVIDLLYRTRAGWFLADFKTDRANSESDALAIVHDNGYDAQVARYTRAIADQLEIQVKPRLIFLNVSDHLAIIDMFNR